MCRCDYFDGHCCTVERMVGSTIELFSALIFAVDLIIIFFCHFVL